VNLIGQRRSAVAVAVGALGALTLAAILVANSPIGSPAATPNGTAQAQPTAAPTLLRSAGQTAAPLIHVHDSGLRISYDYPSDWLSLPAGFGPGGWTNGDPSNVANPCCTLAPNQFLVGIVGFTLQGDVASYRPDGAEVRLVQDWIVVKVDMPITDGSAIDVHTYWTIARPGLYNQAIGVSALFRGPGLAAMEAMMEEFVATIALDAAPSAGPS